MKTIALAKYQVPVQIETYRDSWIVPFTRDVLDFPWKLLFAFFLGGGFHVQRLLQNQTPLRSAAFRPPCGARGPEGSDDLAPGTSQAQKERSGWASPSLRSSSKEHAVGRNRSKKDSSASLPEVAGSACSSPVHRLFSAFGRQFEVPSFQLISLLDSLLPPYQDDSAHAFSAMDLVNDLIIKPARRWASGSHLTELQRSAANRRKDQGAQLV